MNVARQVAAQLAAAGVDTVFGLMGDGNLRVVPFLTDDHGVRYVAARHENGAVAMADAFARVSGRVGVCTVTQGPGLTNALTALTEAARSNTPLVLVTGAIPASAPAHNQRLDHAAVSASLGIEHLQLANPPEVAAELGRALARAARELRPIVVSIPIDVQEAEAQGDPQPVADALPPPAPDPSCIASVLRALEEAERPLILAGRGAVHAGARDSIIELADLIGALVTTTVMAKGLFGSYAFSLEVCGGLASPAAAELISQADVVLVLGASLNPSTTRNGSMFEAAHLIQCDVTDAERRSSVRVHQTVVGDAKLVAAALASELRRSGHTGIGYRRAAFAHGVRELTRERFTDQSRADSIDPRSLMEQLEQRLPDERTVVVDSGYHVVFPTTLLSVPDARGFVFAQGFQALGLGIGGVIGAAVARPDRLSVLVIGDGGLMMTLGELDTISRYRLPILVVVMNDAAYGAEIHTMNELGLSTRHAFFQDRDLAAIARALGFRTGAIRRREDCSIIESWLASPEEPLLLDCKINWRVLGNWGD